jgi:hypothetical protein
MQYAGVPKAAAWFLSPLLELLAGSKFFSTNKNLRVSAAYAADRAMAD